MIDYPTINVSGQEANGIAPHTPFLASPPARAGIAADNESHTAALAFRRAGLCVIPCVAGSKRPALPSWRPYQDEMPSEPDLRHWFATDEPRNLAIVCGVVSGNLVVLDFDTATGYERWCTEYSDLARRAPTVATARGRHVYVRTYQPVKKTKLRQGIDVQGQGAYVIAPPSVHPTGLQYRRVSGDWHSIPVVGALPIPSIDIAGHAGHAADSGHAANTSRHIACVPESVLSGGVLDAIRRTLPTGPGERNGCVFRFARVLKAVRPDAQPQELQAIVRDWHAEALPVIRTKDFTETWMDFVVAWKRVKVPEGRTMQAIVARAKAMPPPPIALQYDDPAIRQLVALCWCLDQHHNGKQFPLACRLVERFLEIPRMSANRMLETLVFDGVLELVRPAVHAKRRAAEYRFIGMEGC